MAYLGPFQRHLKELCMVGTVCVTIDVIIPGCSQPNGRPRTILMCLDKATILFARRIGCTQLRLETVPSDASVGWSFSH